MFVRMHVRLYWPRPGRLVKNAQRFSPFCAPCPFSVCALRERNPTAQKLIQGPLLRDAVLCAAREAAHARLKSHQWTFVLKAHSRQHNLEDELWPSPAATTGRAM